MADEFSLLKNTRLMMQLNDKSLRFVGETRPDPNKYSLLDVVSFLEGGSSNLETIAGENTAAYVSFCFPSFKDAENLLLENYKVNSLQSYTEMKKSLDRLNKFLNMDVGGVYILDWWGGGNYQAPFGERSEGGPYRAGDTSKRDSSGQGSNGLSGRTDSMEDSYPGESDGV